jgi:hypothetical protein
MGHHPRFLFSRLFDVVQIIWMDRCVLRPSEYLFFEGFIVTGGILNSKPKEWQSLKH